MDKMIIKIGMLFVKALFTFIVMTVGFVCFVAFIGGTNILTTVLGLLGMVLCIAIIITFNASAFD